MLNKKRNKSEIKEENNKKKQNNNKFYNYNQNQNYTLDGYGKLKLIDGNLDIFGYSLSKNEIIEFNFNEDYPLFKHINSKDSFSNFEIFEESKYHIYTDINSLNHVSYVPKPLINLDINKYSKYLICGKKCVGKNMLIPYLINRYLSNKKTKVYYLECDIIHPLIPLNFCISLIEITKPIISNIPIIFHDNKENYNMIKSFYIRNSLDIRNILNDIDILIKEFYLKVANDESILLINQFSAWDSNDDIINNYLYKKYFKFDDKSCVLYVKNKYKIIETLSNENKDKNYSSIFEDIVLKNKNDFYILGNLFENKNFINSEIKCTKIEIETNFKYDDDDSTFFSDLNTKKRYEEKISILSYFEEKNCKIYSLPLNNIIIIFDSPFINELQSNSKTEEDNMNLNNVLIESLLNKFCVILRNNLDLKTKENNNNKKSESLLENYFLNDISYDKREVLSFTKIISYDKKEKKICLYCNIDINKEIEKNRKIFVLLEPRIEKIIKKSKKDMFFTSLAKAQFSYDITNENETINISNGLNYLGKNEEELL